ncbi:tRNA (N(6)-L-threonylcarbamoyladenosine(37)-C(2))-methylthiotransferase MtaB [Estrella lausannensis]|uniref:tRNA-2-methylthio-N(6)-dimethylallyladenosine synthase n=1 Tax=Estrella lausannensis TaxID=483423 RepID=A0A0H5DP11_9BACT|nr:tRNA (N(6)-L-threonylcarbamoyladenosine(37)-C(2))-methylthiotransferase MtaB [Estrella lausannensis]CRX38206.1 Threonylcarbamoyladenosine tRNA methylthiotransferase MtaB [Estrella lausannensis]
MKNPLHIVSHNNQEDRETPFIPRAEKGDTYRIVTLGCRTNQYESQAYQDQLREMGLRKAEEGESASLCIVNTCTVTEQAESSSRYEIRSLAKANPGSKILVTGCAAERDPDSFKALPGVHAVIGNAKKDQLLASVFDEATLPEFSIKRFEAHTRAFVKVQDGCNSFCSYCIIPYVRGRSRSRSIPEILVELRDLVQNGFKEVVLTGINIGDFDGKDASGNPWKLAQLVREVDKIEGIERIRISSIDPDEVDDDLQDAVFNGKKTCPSMHIVLQSGSNAVLKKMRRKYTRQIFFETIDRLKENPDFTFTTDVIVGFPGETEEDHLETLDAMKYVRFAKVHMFPYSDRPRTLASKMPNKVPHEIIQRRKAEVLAAAERYSFDLRSSFIGREYTVLTESQDPKRPGHMMGHTENFLYVSFPYENTRSNEIAKVRLLENAPDCLIGQVVRGA